jgi:hypothetical protein
MAERTDDLAALPNMPALLFGLAEALAPFVAAWRALPEDIRASADRNLADVLGVFPAEDRPALTVGDLAALAAAYPLVAEDPDDETLETTFTAAQCVTRSTL